MNGRVVGLSKWMILLLPLRHVLLSKCRHVSSEDEAYYREGCSVGDANHNFMTSVEERSQEKKQKTEGGM